MEKVYFGEEEDRKSRFWDGADQQQMTMFDHYLELPYPL